MQVDSNESEVLTVLTRIGASDLGAMVITGRGPVHERKFISLTQGP